MTAEWMPVNPCDTCPSDLRDEDCGEFRDCRDKTISDGEKKGQRKLLEYLEGKCGHRYYDPSWGYREFKNRFDCSDCRAKVHEELGI